MSRHEYEVSRQIIQTGPPFYALIMAAMRQADTFNAEKLRFAFPAVAVELQSRYNAPLGQLPDDPPYRGPGAADQYVEETVRARLRGETPDQNKVYVPSGYLPDPLPRNFEEVDGNPQ